VKNKQFNFHGSKFTIKVLTSESNGRYTVLDIFHGPNLGPALHKHSKGPETFYIIEGDYEFILDGKSIMAKAGDVILIPMDVPHRFVTGKDGGHSCVISPPELEFYFWKVGELLAKGKVPWDTEIGIAKQFGQIYLDVSKS
jgi:quercetin dioxygenase-like cupin family protein